MIITPVNNTQQLLVFFQNQPFYNPPPIIKHETPQQPPPQQHYSQKKRLLAKVRLDILTRVTSDVHNRLSIIDELIIFIIVIVISGCIYTYPVIDEKYFINGHQNSES